MVRKNTKRKPDSDSKPVITEFGTRKISNQNFSKLVALPKTALMNCGNSTTTQVDVKLVQQNGERFIKLTPICDTKGDQK
jgi:hypothetical protein